MSWRRAIDAALFAGLLLAVALRADLRRLEAMARQRNPVLRTPAVALEPPSGRDLEGRRFVADSRKCWAARFADPGCLYCRQDDGANWPTLARELAAAGCAMVLVPPSLNDSYIQDQIPGSVEQIALVSNVWAGQFRINYLPTTIVVDGGEVRWYGLGKLSAGDLKQAIAVASALGRIKAR
ncbi:MAG TPA: hypothetical protein VNF74_09145 [Terriglobales bacterium]|nr:hypothetical protein [Terriglobales bacterium]